MVVKTEILLFQSSAKIWGSTAYQDLLSCVHSFSCKSLHGFQNEYLKFPK